MIDNTPVVLSKYPMLQSLSIESSNFEDNLLYVIKLNTPMKEVNIVLEDNNIEMNIDYLGGCGKKILIKIPSTRYLRYDWLE